MESTLEVDSIWIGLHLGLWKWTPFWAVLIKEFSCIEGCIFVY